MLIGQSSDQGSPVGESALKILTLHREVLVDQVKNTQCILDNLLSSGFVCNEDVEIIQRCTTKTDQVRNILELVQSKGEEASAYFIHILHEAYDAFIDLRPWFKDIDYKPSEFVQQLPVVNTDPISKYCEKLRHDLGRDTRFITSYSQREETRLEELYTDTQMEILNESNESQGYLENLDDLIGEKGVFNQDAETIFVTGDAGVGKSIMLQKLQNLWSKRELDTRAKFFFKFRCRMFSAFKETDEISLKDLIFKHNCYPDMDPDNEVFSYILRFPETVIFTFDGYDEIHSDFDLSNLPEVVSPEERTHPLLVLMNLLCGKLLKGSLKVLTARTGTEVQNRVVRKRVILKGFSPNHLQRYTALHFPDREHLALVTMQLDASPHLGGLCSIPLFCWIIFKSFKHLQSVYSDIDLPGSCVTLTSVFLLLSEVFLSRSSPPGLLKRSTRCTADTFRAGGQVLTAYAHLALLGMVENRFVFQQEDVTSCGLEEDDLQIGYIRTVSQYDGCGSAATFEFLHVTLQSFLAAFALVLDKDSDPSEILKFFTQCEYRKRSRFPCASCLGRSQPRDKDPFKTNEHLQFINLFLCGLLSKPNRSLVEQLVPPLLLKKKQSLLKTYLSNSVKLHLRSLPRYKSEFEGTKVHAMSTFVWMVRCIFETNSEDVARLAAKGISGDYLKMAFCNIFSADCSAINFVLHHYSKSLGVDMDNNNISDYGVKQLRPSFSKMTVVRLCVNQITDCSIEVLAEELIRYKVVKTLGLYKNQITDAGAKLIGQIIEECPRIHTLKLGLNKITSIGGQYLASGIKKSKSIFDVGMWGNTIGDKGAEAFAEAMKNHTSLTNLSLSANEITSEGGRYIAEALKNNSSLHIFWLIGNKISDEAASDLSEAIKMNRALTHIMLIDNQFSVHGAKVLAEGMSHNTTLKEINLKGNLVSEEEEKHFEAEPRLRFH
ncbi:hypothetical protein ACEWY4_020527 [Coilia grayii]|uniref:Nucleotide-binding oligomerization domain-containing protein 1 n=1 Tax=Coilia grayii TaxID=363190 RepID=A0ABD1JCY8_9TELE